MRRAFLSALLVSAALLVLAGCGNGERKHIASVLTTGLTSQDPRIVCEGSLSPALLTRICGGATTCHDVERRQPGDGRVRPLVQRRGARGALARTVS